MLLKFNFFCTFNFLWPEKMKSDISLFAKYVDVDEQPVASNLSLHCDAAARLPS